MMAIKGTARSTGLLYLLMGLPAPFYLMYIPNRFFAPRDAASTAANILSGEWTYRLGILAAMFSTVGFLILSLSLYRLLKGVNQPQARMMVAFVIMAAAVGMLDVVLLGAPLMVLKGAVFSATFDKQQLDGIAFMFFKLRNDEINIAATVFWGLWLFPFGILVWKSGFMPKFIGVLLIVGGFCYVANSVTALLRPDLLATLTKFTLPLAGPGEVFAILWLLIKGGDVPLLA